MPLTSARAAFGTLADQPSVNLCHRGVRPFAPGRDVWEVEKTIGKASQEVSAGVHVARERSILAVGSLAALVFDVFLGWRPVAFVREALNGLALGSKAKPVISRFARGGTSEAWSAQRRTLYLWQRLRSPLMRSYRWSQSL